MNNDEKAVACVEAFKPLADAAEKLRQFVCFYVIEFQDGGPIEGQCLHVGSREDCEKTAELISAVSYSGDRAPKKSTFHIGPQIDPPMRAGERFRV